MAIYIESIVNPIILPFFTRRGFATQDLEAIRPCFYCLHTNSNSNSNG